jgi:hypothetical protein
MTSGRMGSSGYVAFMVEIKDVCKIWVGRPKAMVSNLLGRRAKSRKKYLRATLHKHPYFVLT